MEQVEIHIKGQIDQNWSDWLSGLSIAHEKNDTVLKGLVADQSALYGVLFQLSDLGIQLISLTYIMNEDVPVASWIGADCIYTRFNSWPPALVLG